MSALVAQELRFLRAEVRSLARIGTVAADGTPHVVPGGWSWAEDSGEILLTGRDVPATARAGHVRRTGVAAVSIDGIQESGGWAPWALLARGPAVVDDSAGVIRLRSDWARSGGWSPSLPDEAQ